MTKEEYERLLQSDYWKGYSYSLIKERNFTCEDCGRSFPNERNRLQVHHLVYRDVNPWSYRPEEVVVLCEECHRRRHGLHSEPEPKPEILAEAQPVNQSQTASYDRSEGRYNHDDGHGQNDPFTIENRGRKKIIALGAALVALLLVAFLHGRGDADSRDPINDTVLRNLSGRGHSDRDRKKKLIAEKERELGRKVTKKEQDEIERQCAREKTAKIYGEAAGHAAMQGLMYAMGNAVLLIVKPMYFELKDGFTNGFIEGVGASSAKEAFKIRFCRIRDYVWKQLASIKTFLTNGLEFLKNFLSTLIESLINMFVGLFKQILKVVKEGVKLVMQASSVLFGKASRNLSTAEKGDAIVRMIGGSIAAFCGIAIDSLLKDLPDENLRGVVSTFVSGLAGILVFYAIDKADLFNVKEERRNKRIREIFEMRIEDIRSRMDDMSTAACEKMRESSIRVAEFLEGISSASESLDYTLVSKQTSGLYEYLFGERMPELRRGVKWDC